MSEFTCISPVNGEVLVTRPFASAERVSAAVSKARTAQKAWAKLSLERRAVLCSGFVDAMLSMKDDIVPELARQMGRPVRYGAGELGGFEDRARHMIASAEEALQPIVPAVKEGFERSITREPLGIVFTIAPWNYPYLTAVNSVVPALMAGNAVLLKHAAQTLLVGERFQAAADKAGLPEGLLTNLALSHDQTTQIISSRQVDMVCFTGSVEGLSNTPRQAISSMLALNWAARIQLTSGPMPTSRTPSKIWSTAHSSTAARAVAGLNAFTSTKVFMINLWRALWHSPDPMFWAIP